MYSQSQDLIDRPMRSVSIIMYHYVRKLKHSRYPEIKGLPTDQFSEQIAYIKKHYNVISGPDLLDAVETGDDLPPQALLLTFDDGYIDHFTEVFPILEREKISGCFFPPAECILENRVLDVNKIHFVLASVPDRQKIIDYIFHMIDEYHSPFGLQDKSYYWNTLRQEKNRYDDEEVVFIKRTLQRALPEQLRKIMVDALFEKYVSADEGAFARELYMSLEQVTYLQEEGMYIGNHGYNHWWLNSLDRAAQEQEIDLSLDFLRQVGTPLDRWIMCYPYGAYNDTLLSILESRNCTVGIVGRKLGIANLERDHPLTLPRLDTNDLPKVANAQPNQWTLEALQSAIPAN